MSYFEIIPYIHKNGRKNICTQKRLVISRCFFSSKMHSWLLNYSSFFDDIKGKTIYVRTTYHIATFYTRFISVSRSQVTSWKQKLREYLVRKVKDKRLKCLPRMCNLSNCQLIKNSGSSVSNISVMNNSG